MDLQFMDAKTFAEYNYTFVFFFFLRQKRQIYSLLSLRKKKTIRICSHFNPGEPKNKSYFDYFFGWFVHFG